MCPRARTNLPLLFPLPPSPLPAITALSKRSNQSEDQDCTQTAERSQHEPCLNNVGTVATVWKHIYPYYYAIGGQRTAALSQTKIEEMPPKRKPTVHVQPGDGGPVHISEINCNDVIFGRGHSLNDNAGTININFKNRIEAARPKYLISEKHDKKHLAAKVVMSQFRFEASDRQMAGRRCSKLEDVKRRLAEAEAIQQELEQELALERQSRIEAERRLDEERRANAEQEQRRSAEQQRRSAEQQRAMASLQVCMQHLQLSFEDDS